MGAHSINSLPVFRHSNVANFNLRLSLTRRGRSQLKNRFHCEQVLVAVCTLVVIASANVSIGHAQIGQSQTVAGSNPNNQTTANARIAPAPWRPQFGTIARQSQATPANSTIPAKQPIQNSPQSLPAPNSPYNQPSPTGINLQTGQTTQLGSSLPPAIPSQTSTVTSAQSTAPTALPVNNGNPNPATQNQSQTLTSQTNSQTPTAQSQFTEPANQPLQQGTITRVTKTMSKLPNDAGQIWREYDITPYTSQITGIADPQQAILDWILKETGTEMWFNQPLGILNADKNQLRVYHTPEIQDRVHRIVDRFVNTRGQVQNIEISLVTIKRPNWRATAYPVLQPIEVQSPGVEAWMVTKENAALLRASLARRGDFKDHGTGRIATNDGQSVVLRNTKPVQFIRNFRWTGNQIPPYQPLVTTIDEGYTLEISSLTSLDGNTIEASVECHVDQVEKLNNVRVDVPGSIGATTDKISLQIPQLVSWRLQERFRWPNDQVLLLSCGVVATPGPQNSLPTNFPNILGGNRQRADALLFIDYRGPELVSGNPASTARNRTVPIAPRR